MRTAGTSSTDPTTISNASLVEKASATTAAAGGASFSSPLSEAQPAETPLQRALFHLKSCENDFGHANAKLREFMTAHTVTFGGRTVFVGKAVTEGYDLGQEYLRLLRAQDAARERLQEALKTWALAKSEGQR